jgi:hypothetical protein
VSNIENESRAQFEAWAITEGLSLNSRYGSYFLATTEKAWRAWQASRQALVISKPEQCIYANTAGDYAKGHRQGIRSMVDAIESQGVKCK